MDARFEKTPLIRKSLPYPCLDGDNNPGAGSDRHSIRFERLARLPVLPIAVYLKVGLDGIGIDKYQENFWEQLEFERLVATQPYQGVQAMNTTWYEKGIESKKGVRSHIQWEKNGAVQAASHPKTRHCFRSCPYVERIPSSTILETYVNEG